MRYYLPRLAVFAGLTLMLWLARDQAQMNPTAFALLAVLLYFGAALGVTQRD